MKAIFNREFRFACKKTGIVKYVQPSEEPQTQPREIIKAGVEAGAAELVEPQKTKDPKS